MIEMAVLYDDSIPCTITAFVAWIFLFLLLSFWGQGFGVVAR